MYQDSPLPAWQHVFRNGFAPVLSTAALTALRDALANNDSRLVQGQTTIPPPWIAVRDFPCEAGCAISFAGWLGDDLPTIGEVDEFFGRACLEADERLGEAGACGAFLVWFDDTPWLQMRRELLPEIELVLAARPDAPVMMEMGGES